jgi:hypothetical protein
VTLQEHFLPASSSSVDIPYHTIQQQGNSS